MRSFGLSMSSLGAASALLFTAGCTTTPDSSYYEVPQGSDLENRHADIVKHDVGSGPVQILNIFEEHGLTDPHVMEVDGRLYMGMGHDHSWDTESDWTMDRWEIWSTDDLKTWVKETTILPEDTYFGPAMHCWAGDFAQKDGKYYWYFSNRFHDTGVMVADEPGGPYRDALGKPLIPEELTATKSYDPEVYEENGEFTIIFGAGQYYAAKLGADMLSLAETPTPIIVETAGGETVATDDKPTVFKRDGRYYLVWGAHYAMSDTLRGPYQYVGSFMGGGHGSIFEWQGQWYVVHEHHDISMYYRGIMLKPLIFNDDGTVNLEQDAGYPIGGGRSWDYDISRMGWRTVRDTDLVWTSNGTIGGNSSGEMVIESANWASGQTQGRDLTIRVRNNTAAKRLKLSFANFDSSRPSFWSYPEIDWSKEASITIDIAPGKDRFVTYSLPLDTVENLPPTLKRLRLSFENAGEGAWEIDHIRIQ